MFHRLVLIAFATTLLASAGLGDEEQYELKERYEKDSVESADSQVELKVDMKVSVGKQEGKLPMKFKGVQKYTQKILKTDDSGQPVKVARHFEKSTMDIQHPASKPQSGSTAYEGKTYIIEKTKDGTKAELLGGGEVSKQATAELGLAVDGSRHKLLPGKLVETGATWEVPLNAIREVFNIPGNVQGKAKAALAEIKDYEEKKCAIIRVELEMKVPQGGLILNYKGQGKVYFSLKDKRITSYNFSAKIEVGGSQKSDYGEMKFSGEGTAKSLFKTAPGKGEIDLTPPKKELPKEEDKQEKPAGKDSGGQ